MVIPNEGNLATRRWRVLAGVTLGFMLFLAAIGTRPALADSTVSVNSTCTLPQAVVYADGGTEPGCASGTASGTTTINVPASTNKYSVSIPLSITRDTTINGAGALATVIDGGGVQVLNISVSVHVLISGVTISGGNTGDTDGCINASTCPMRDGLNGGGISNAGILTLQSSIITGNKTSPGRPASPPLFVCSSPPLTCPPESGQSAGNGGSGAGIDNQGTLTVTNSTISNNTAGNGGSATNGLSGTGNSAGAGQPGGAGGAGGSGGGLFNESGATATITNSTISGNAAGTGGNAGAGSNATAPADLGGNAGSAGGGGFGGGIYNLGTLALIASTVSGNKSGIGGNGADGGTGQCQFQSNCGGSSSSSAPGGSGGAVYSNSGNTLTATNDTIANNAASAGGTGGAGAGAGGLGGGVINQGIGLIALTYVTVAGNQAAGAGGGLYLAPGLPMTEANSIVSSNNAPAANNCGGSSPTDDGHNLVFGEPSCPGTTADPRLSLLANNGGPTPTMSLNPGSAAIDLVSLDSCLLRTDQRGVSRPQGAACDAGAYEFAPPVLSGVADLGHTTNAATIGASVNPNVKDTTVVVLYGRTSGYGSATAPRDVGAGNSPTSITAGLTGLTPNTTYHFDVVATNGDGSTVSGDRTFTTLPPVTASIASMSASGPTLSLTIACGGGSGPGACDGPISLTSHVTTQGATTVAVASRAKHKAKKPKPKRVTKNVTVGKGSYLVATGKRVTIKIKLNSPGQKLLTQRYSLPTTVSLAGTTVMSRRVTFNYPVIHAPLSFTWAFTTSSTVAQQLSVTGIPSAGKVIVICHGGGCPFGQRTFSSHHGRVSLTSALGHSNLRPGATVELEITASNQVGKVVIFTIRSNRQPTLSEGCLPPGARGPMRCA